MILACCEPELPMPDVYALLVRMLDAVASTNVPRALLPRFSLRLLDALGLAPPLDACVHCGRPLSSGRLWLDVDSGGFVDAPCREPDRAGFELEAGDLQSLGAKRRATGRATEAVEMLVAHHLGR
jgi:recombinational DNA repair protein (RecF pathway)